MGEKTQAPEPKIHRHHHCTGARQRFPHPRLTGALGAKRIGLEVMDLKAACRTYNILVAEERKVAAALLFA